jgi:isopentenyl diphosphate isomerase/L-lactate dehydrogenase-like FMN-dependent dehydrogenase
MTADGLEAAARQVLPPGALSYVAGGASTERTIAANREAFARWRIVPRMLRGVTERDLSTTVLGTPMTAPVLTAPIGVLGLVHPDADLAVTRAAAALGLASVLSTGTSPPRHRMHRAGSSCTGPAISSWPSRWCAALTRPATGPSC